MGGEVTSAATAAREEASDRARLRGQRVFGSFFGPVPRVLAGIALGVSAIMPPDGVGFSLCVFQRFTGLPCPGCGLTRSIACITHLEPRAAWSYHPFGYVAYPIFVLAFLSNALGPLRRQRMQRWFESHGDVLHRACWVLAIAFLAFGVARLAIEWRYRGSFGV